MALTTPISCQITAICIVIMSGGNLSLWSQPDHDAYLESLSAADIIAGMTENLNRIRTYKATFVVSDPNGNDPREYTMGWERVAGSGDNGIHDKRFYNIIPSKDSKAYKSRNYSSKDLAFNGKKGFLCITRHEGRRKSIRGTILPTLDGQMVGLGLTLNSLSTHYMDSSPYQLIVNNGTFVKEGVELVDGQKCVILYGELGYAEPGPFQVKHGPGSYIKMFIDPLSGFMPVKRVHYAVTEVEGDLVRKLPITYAAQLKEFEGGIWFPIAGTYDSKHFKWVLKAKDVSLNMAISQEDFTIAEWPPGTEVEDKVRNVSFKVPLPWYRR
jgi:hypothetical protein